VTKAPAALSAGLAVHFIGQLQSNKVRPLAGLVDVWETVDRSRLVGELARRAPGSRVLVQVDATGEPGKGGCPLSDVPALVAEAVAAGLIVEGLMTVGPTEGGPEAARPGFRAVRRLVDELGLTTCSMGMTADLDVAVEEGSTEVRVGTALFGARPR
jgi:PLP dependent protein